MLSRRIIRIKIMQLMYAMSNDNELNTSEILKLYNTKIQQSYNLYLFNLSTTGTVSNFAKKDKEKRVTKLLPTDADVNFLPKLALNESTASINEHAGFVRELAINEIDVDLEESTIKSVYTDFTKTQEYKDYQEKKDTKPEDDKAVLLALYKFCLSNELFEDVVDDRYSNWEDDKSLVVGAIKRTINKSKNKKVFQIILPIDILIVFSIKITITFTQNFNYLFDNISDSTITTVFMRNIL